MNEELLEEARQIIRDCEEAKAEEIGSEYGRNEEERSAYRRLRELLLAE